MFISPLFNFIWITLTLCTAHRGLVSISNVTIVNKLQLHKRAFSTIKSLISVHIIRILSVQLEFHEMQTDKQQSFVYDFIRTVNVHCSLLISRALHSRLFTKTLFDQWQCNNIWVLVLVHIKVSCLSFLSRCDENLMWSGQACFISSISRNRLVSHQLSC